MLFIQVITINLMLFIILLTHIASDAGQLENNSTDKQANLGKITEQYTHRVTENICAITEQNTCAIVDPTSIIVASLTHTGTYTLLDQ